MIKSSAFWKFLTILIFALSLGQLSLGLIKLLNKGFLLDFAVYYEYTDLFFSGANPYQRLIPFNYPPSFFLIFSIFSLFPLTISQYIFTIISLSSLLISVFILLFKIKPKIHWSM